MSWSSRFSFPILVICSFMFITCGCDQNPPGQDITARDNNKTEIPDTGLLQKVKLLPYWVTTAQFAGYYVGIKEGIFKKYGIDLEIINFQPTMQTNQIIRDKEADFFLLWLVNAIELRASGIDIVNIAQPSSRSSLMLLTKKSSGIQSITDMDGKRAAIWSGYELQPRALFKKHHVDVDIISIGSSNNLFLTDGVAIINANWFDEYHTILNSGYNADELETFFFSDFGLNFLEDGIYCLQSTIDEDPGLCKRFVEATLASWKYAFDHPEEAIEIVLNEQRQQKIPATLAHQRWMLDRYRDLYYPDSSRGINTTLAESEYLNIAKILLEAGLIQTIPSFEEFCHPVRTVENRIQDTLNRSR